MKITSRPLGPVSSGATAKSFSLINNNGISILITDYGCTLMSLLVPDRTGKEEDIITGYSSWEEWLRNPAYFGCLIGRTCNRIGGAQFSLDSHIYKVTANHGNAQLHGGFEGFSHKLWKANSYSEDNLAGIRFEYHSADGEEGFPGNLIARANYCLTNQDEFIMELEARTDKATPVNMTNHTYFNLAGEGSGDIYQQVLQIKAEHITETDADSIPTGRLIPVNGTPYDFRQPHPIGERIHFLEMGYDNNFALNKQSGDLALAVIARDPASGRVLEIYTTEPGIQFYTSNWFDGSMIGKCGKRYLKHWAFALETQHYPDSMNHREFPNVILRPGEVYRSTTVWKFRTD
jgi:aldose 1-epimerase